MSSVFNNLNAIDFSDKTFKKKDLTYIPWAVAWEKVKSMFPTASYEVVKYDGRPYLFDENLGYMIETNVTIDGETLPMHLPVMDGANKAMKAQPYTYSTKYGDKTVEAATMFDINKTIMRCLVKNLALFGAGLYIYRKEETPIFNINTLKDVITQIKTAKTVSELESIWEEYDYLHKNNDFVNLIKLKKQQLNSK